MSFSTEKQETNSEEALGQSIALNTLVLSLLEERKKDNQRTWVFLAVICLMFCILFGLVANNAYKEKVLLVTQLEDTRVDFMEFLDSIEVTTTEDVSETTITDNSSIEQSVEGDGAEINNVQGDQYKDDAVHNSGGE